MTKRGRGQRAGLDSVRGEWEVKGDGWGRNQGPDGAEKAAVEAREATGGRHGRTDCEAQWARASSEGRETRKKRDTS